MNQFCRRVVMSQCAHTQIQEPRLQSLAVERPSSISVELQRLSFHLWTEENGLLCGEQNPHNILNIACVDVNGSRIHLREVRGCLHEGGTTVETARLKSGAAEVAATYDNSAFRTTRSTISSRKGLRWSVESA